MFKTQVDPQAAGEFVHCKVLNIYGVISMINSTDNEKVRSIFFLQRQRQFRFTKTRAEWKTQLGINLALSEIMKNLTGCFTTF